MSTNVPYHFVMAKLATGSIRVKKLQINAFPLMLIPEGKLLANFGLIGLNL